MNAINNAINVLCISAALAGCPSPIDVPPEGVVTAPRHGAMGRSDSLVVEGLYNVPGAAVTAERWDPTSHSWVVTGTGATGTSGVDDEVAPLYPFQFSLAVRDGWPTGGLLSLRVRVADFMLSTLDSDGSTQPCIDARTTWHDRIAGCASAYSTITLVDGNVQAPRGAHRFLDLKGSSTWTDTTAYYRTINAPPTLGAFLQTYGLDDPATPTLTYYNLGDLAVGREIRCKPHASAMGTGVACTTFNYGKFSGPVDEGLDKAVAGRTTGAGWFANVSMVYDPPITAPNAVKFVVYDSRGNQLTRAPLDTRGDNASIPENCINCHGSDGTYDPVNHRVTGARFLPFDPSAFAFSDKPGMTRADQEATMRALNQMFLTAAPSNVLAETVRGWYGGREPLVGVADTSAVPAAWQGAGTASIYRNVVATTCRGCHASRNDMLAFATPDQLRVWGPLIAQTICGHGRDSAHAMPSAEASLVRFWSGAARAYLAGFVGPEFVGGCPGPPQ